jgi:hypothetical protein
MQQVLRMQASQRLREKLYRELTQSEHDAIVHCSREARRYGAQPPGQVLRAIADHARELRPRLYDVWGTKPWLGVRAGRAIGEAFSTLRHVAVDWVLDAERSYRATLLDLHHGLDVARLLRDVLARQHDDDGRRVCDQLVDRRDRLLSRAQHRLRWFAEHPEMALRSARAQISSPFASLQRPAAQRPAR